MEREKNTTLKFYFFFVSMVDLYDVTLGAYNLCNKSDLLNSGHFKR